MTTSTMQLKISDISKSIDLITFEESGLKKVTATALKVKTGECLDMAQRQPLAVEKNGRPVAVLMAMEDYERLANLENDYWLARAEAAEKKGFAGTKASAKFLRDRLKSII